MNEFTPRPKTLNIDVPSNDAIYWIKGALLIGIESLDQSSKLLTLCNGNPGNLHSLREAIHAMYLLHNAMLQAEGITNQELAAYMEQQAYIQSMQDNANITDPAEPPTPEGGDEEIGA